MGAWLAAFTAIATALGSISKSFSDYVALQTSANMQELGQLRQENVLLRAENADLRTRNAALVAAAGTSGAARL